jgi:hypothetical protein
MHTTAGSTSTHTTYPADRVTTARQVLTNLGVDVDAAPIHDWIRDRCLDDEVIAFPLLRAEPGAPLGRPFAIVGSSPAIAQLMPVRPVSKHGLPDLGYRYAPVAPLFVVVDDGRLTVVMGA